jgi:hypothetical protein
MRNAVSHFTPLTIYLTTSLNPKHVLSKTNLIKKLQKKDAIKKDYIGKFEEIERKVLEFVEMKNNDK